MSIFSKLLEQGVELSPFPHAVIAEAAQTGFARELIESRPALELVASKYSRVGRVIGNPSAFPGEKVHLRSCDLLNEPCVSDTWKDVVRQYLGMAEIGKLLRAFTPAIQEEYPELERRWGKIDTWSVGQRYVDSPSEHVLLADVQLSYHAPSPGAMVAERGPHLKISNKLLICQYFLRISESEEDEFQGGDFQLYGINDLANLRPGQLQYGKDQQIVNTNRLTLAKTVPYRANTAVIFLNTPRSVQAFAEHGRTKHPCCYMNVIVEFAEPIFSLL